LKFESVQESRGIHKMTMFNKNDIKEFIIFFVGLKKYYYPLKIYNFMFASITMSLIGYFLFKQYNSFFDMIKDAIFTFLGMTILFIIIVVLVSIFFPSKIKGKLRKAFLKY
jgi:hypothetical protein